MEGAKGGNESVPKGQRYGERNEEDGNNSERKTNVRLRWRKVRQERGMFVGRPAHDKTRGPKATVPKEELTDIGVI